MQINDNQLSISLEAAMDVLSSLSTEQILLAIAA
jgi:hypothetical protein